MTGKDFYESLARENLLRAGEGTNHAKYATEKLKELGIPGIRYLDGMSRDGGSGTYNYVMFDDKGIKLLERNGQKINDLLAVSDFAIRRADQPQPYKEYIFDSAAE
jgi:hypothetical protein